MENIVKCDYCHKDFKMAVIEKDKELFFLCDHCGHRYFVAYTNDKIKEYQKEIQDIIKSNDRKIEAIQIQVKNTKKYNPKANVKSLVNKGNKLIKKANKEIKAIQGKIKAEMAAVEQSKVE